MNPIPELIAHRGYASRYPENTLLALQAAVEAGARYLEFDVQLSADHVPLLLHDVDLQRTGNDARCVFECTADELQCCAVGEPARFGDRFADQTLPSLACVAEWLASEPGVTAFVEIKRESIERFGIPRVQQAVWQVLQPVREQVVLISYHDAFLFAARNTALTAIGWVVAGWDDLHARRARALGADYLFTNWQRLPPAPQPLWSGPWRWAVYEVVEAAQARALAARGIQFVETMAIGELAGELARTR